MTRLSVSQRQAVPCPTCGARRGTPCRGSRIPPPSTLGGGWGGPPELRREHAARIADARIKEDGGVATKPGWQELAEDLEFEARLAAW